MKIQLSKHATPGTSEPGVLVFGGVSVNSSVIGKIEKAKRYAMERDRIQFTDLSIDFHGENGDHKVTFANDKWHCTCDFFEAGYGACAHTMALERVLDRMLPASATSSQLLQHA